MTSEEFGMFRAAVAAIIGEDSQQPRRDWTIQGFGMMRCYFGSGDRYRLNVWDPHYTVPNVSLIHDHPWDFRSVCFAGLLANTKFLVEKPHDMALPASAQGCEGVYHFGTIKTGPNGGPADDSMPQECYLYPQRTTFYGPGDSYCQKRDEVHATHYRPGTVTLNDRTNRNGENARVFWVADTDWVDAKPRRATQNEVRSTLALALQQFAA
jgi:hypothetical protein